MHRFPRGDKGCQGAPVSMQESDGAGAHGCCSFAPSSTAHSRHPACPEHCLPSTLLLQKLQWERPKSPSHAAEQPSTLTPVMAEQQRICKGCSHTGGSPRFVKGWLLQKHDFSNLFLLCLRLLNKRYWATPYLMLGDIQIDRKSVV